MNTRVRTLPIRVPPVPGEALDSWTEALARRLDSPLGEVLHHLGLPPRTGHGDHLRGIPRDWTILLSGAHTTNIAHASGLDERTVTDMTLMYYDGRAVRINTERPNVNRRVLWGRGSGSHFCPDCLIESGGRWLLSWRLGCSFACLHHGRLLADCCPACNQIPRERPAATPAIPRPHTCGSPYPGPGGGFSKGCGFDLTQTRTLRLPASHPALLAQVRLLDVIDADTAAFGAYQYSPQSARQALTDIQAIARRVLQDLPASDLRDLIPRDIADGHLITDPGCPLASRAAERPGFMAPPRAVSTAASVAIALHVLDQPDIHLAGRVLRDLIEAMREELWQVSITSIDGWGRDLSTVLNAVHIAALAPSMRPNEQLRHRTPTAMPRRTEKTSRDIDRRARKIPSMFWPVWTTRLTPPEGVYPRAIAPVLAASLLIVGSKARLEDVAGRLGSATTGINISRILQWLQDQPQWTDTAVALVRLADHLDATEVPIDYQRRRRLDYTRLLPRSRWSQICRRTGTPVGRGPREQIVRSLLFQRISGLPAEAFPRHQNVTEAEFRQQSAYFAALQTPELADALAGEARHFLAENRIHNEPITWQPPATLLSGLDLPGSDPDHIDVPRLHQLVRQHKRPVQHAARVLDTSIAAIRYVLDEHPAPAAEETERSARSTVQIRQRARREIPKDVLTRLYLDEHHSLQTIADMTGFSRGLLTDLAREYDIPIVGFQGRQPRVTIERSWLFEQYVVRRRPLPDLAREQGMSRSNMARWARVHNIPLRRSGGASHRAALRTTQLAVHLPAILRNGLTSPFAWQRMRSFAAASSFPSMHEAARALNINRSTLVNQINQLEADLGQPLLERATRGRAMKLTSFGKRVIAAMNEIPSEEGVHRALTAPDGRP
ncbi:TniQ family protein [Streptomyces sp. AC558_RSS880]|uniref:TniQ family protein n=1 Tax=Streptomyces sp. AC558_RSS880 TaxID=2823687 RepID=UPI001C2116C9|nr:TniQ family protein [Streptomyces sp. AC558_RSS880]